MRTFPTMQDVKNLIKEEEEKKYLANMPKVMQFYRNDNLSEADRIDQIATDIATEYPEVPRALREKMAEMEEPIKSCHEDYEMFYNDELRIYRLFNMLQVLYPYVLETSDYSPNFPFYKLNTTFNKVYGDIKETYKTFLQHFTYANPGEQKVSKILQLLKEFYNDEEIEIPEH